MIISFINEKEQNEWLAGFNALAILDSFPQPEKYRELTCAKEADSYNMKNLNWFAVPMTPTFASSGKNSGFVFNRP
jgi:hypothetical protein